MAWTAPITFTAGSILTAATLNTYLKTNMDEMAPNLVTTLGGHFIADGVNSLVERVAASNRADALVTTASTTYANLPSGGSLPAVTVTTGTRALIMISANMETQDVNNINCIMSYAISGATTRSTPFDSTAYQSDGITAGSGVNAMQGGVANLEEALTAGSNTFTMKYRTGNASSTARFQYRNMIVVPF